MRTISRLSAVLLKILLAAGLVAWMVRGGKLDLAQVAAAALRPAELLAAAALLFATVPVSAWRWRVLLHAQGLRLSFKDTLSLTMIGLLFNTVIPGAVGGDVIKAYYIAGRAAGKKAHAVTTIVVDRLMGLFTLLVAALAGGLWSSHLVLRSHPLTVLCGIVFGAVVVIGAGFAAAILFSGWTTVTLERMSRRVPVLRFFSRCAAALAEYGKVPSALARAFAIGLPCPFLGSLAFYFSLRALGISAPLEVLIFTYPLGIVTTALPITPAGLGVGQAAFYGLFQTVFPGRGAEGANAFTVYLFVMLFIYLIGLYPYLTYRSKIDSAAVVVDVMPPNRL